MSILLFVLAMFGLSAPAADDGPCPTAQPVIFPGDHYANGMWTTADGELFGLAPAEDSCITALL
jgi:hypothetical protein